jgi:hypothetical protein
MAGLSDLDFSPGLVFQDIVKSRFGVPAPPPLISSSVFFHLVVSLSCSAIRIDQHFVSLILQSCLGENAEDFKILRLQQWCFCFSVSCKNVGIMVHHLKHMAA